MFRGMVVNHRDRPPRIEADKWLGRVRDGTREAKEKDPNRFVRYLSIGISSRCPEITDVRR